MDEDIAELGICSNCGSDIDTDEIEEEEDE